MVNAAGCWSGQVDWRAAHFARTHPVRGQTLRVQAQHVSARHVLRSFSGYVLPRSGGNFVLGSTLEAFSPLRFSKG
ncbi:MAG: FAD-dependent oxidoreductase [Acidobacteria bacterium]|nr:FAD-dependent oxidoreductase [Acidobacteriota bacterium]